MACRRGRCADDEELRVVALKSEDASADLYSCSLVTGECTLLIDGAGVEGDLQLSGAVNLGG